jgi:hypothetical protein
MANLEGVVTGVCDPSIMDGYVPKMDIWESFRCCKRIIGQTAGVVLGHAMADSTEQLYLYF